jgi:hypothetical protein
MPFWEDRAPEIGILDENESGGICDEILEDNERRFDGDCEKKKKMLDNGTLVGWSDFERIHILTLDDGILETAEIVIPWMIWEGKTIPFEKDRAHEAESEIDGIYDEIRVDNIHDPCNFFPLNLWMIL